METPREVISPAAIAARVRELGAQIAADYRGREVVLVGMLKGAAIFLADLLRAIDGQVRFELVMPVLDCPFLDVFRNREVFRKMGFAL